MPSLFKMNLLTQAPSARAQAVDRRGDARRPLTAVPGSAPVALGSVSTRVVDARDVSEADRQAWLALEERALEPNVNYSPLFALPALRHLDPGLKVHLHLAERSDAGGQRRLVGVALVHARRPNGLCPLPYLAAYQTRHAFLGHWLLDREGAGDVAEALLRQIRRTHRWAGAVVLTDCPVDGEQVAVMREAASRLGLPTDIVNRTERAMLVPAEGGLESLRQQLRKQFSNVERCRRRLQEQGTLDWQLLRGRIPESAIEDFLNVEHGGWKRESGTSLRSNPGDEAFFREMSRGFSDADRALFTELRLDGRVIASTSNYLCGRAGFAFKVGWDDAFRKFGLGIFNEAEFVREAPRLCGDLAYMDSGSQPASFIEMLWPRRRQMGTLVILGPLAGRLWPGYWRLKAWAKRVMAKLRARQAAEPAAAAEPASAG